MIIEAIRKRRSIRHYKSAGVDEADLLEIIKAAQFAPTAMNNRAVEFLVITKQDTKSAIMAIIGQPELADAPFLVIPAVDTRRSVIPVQDLSVASSFILLQAVESGLASVWKDVRAELAPQLMELLGIPDHMRMINVLPLGFAKEELEPHSDDEFADHKIHFHQW